MTDMVSKAQHEIPGKHPALRILYHRRSDRPAQAGTLIQQIMYGKTQLPPFIREQQFSEITIPYHRRSIVSGSTAAIRSIIDVGTEHPAIPGKVSGIRRYQLRKIVIVLGWLCRIYSQIISRSSGKIDI